MTVAQIPRSYDDGAGVRMFKKHKVLPHPKRDSRTYGMPLQVSDGRNVPRNLPTLKHQPRRVGSGPDLPPTPPAHSRNSSSSHSVLPSSPTYVESPNHSVENTSIQPPATPPNQKSPPTPDTTPPQPATRPRAVRPLISERAVSRSATATTDSRTESFKTAREDPYSSASEGEAAMSTVRPTVPSARTSQNTVRQASGDGSREGQPVGLGLGLESAIQGKITKRSKEFISFDGEWGSGSEVEQEWDDNLARNVTVKKRRRAPETPRANGYGDEVVEEVMVTPTNATKALRNMPLHDRVVTYPSPKDFSDRGAPWAVPSNSQSSASDIQRLSGMSTKSTASTVVEAILVDGPPRRRKTLRHVRKYGALRDSSSNISPASSAPNSLAAVDENARRPRMNGRSYGDRHESYTSNMTINSIQSGKYRREVWKNGGIPVVVVPDRKSSVKSRSSREPSLRSTSSRRSKRSVSLDSVPLINGSKASDITPYFDRLPRRGRTMSESDRSDQRTIDYPPVIPRRTSSLSAPTSRNTSRAGSLTAESLKAHDALQANQAKRQLHIPEVTLQPAPSFESEKHGRRLSVDHHGDPLFGKRLSAQNTPFSAASIETNGTAPEVSEAMAVSIFPHQNTSVLMVDHARKTWDGIEEAPGELQTQTGPERPAIRTTAPDGDGPVTPPQPQFSMDDVDSPLRNPRAPPEPPTDPPAIKFIPATPSGLTPATEKQNRMGNYFEEMDQAPQRSMSLVRRALTRRRNSEYGPSPTKRPGFIKRTLSLSRNIEKDPQMFSGKRDSVAIEPAPSTLENLPPEENKLHPFWRPAYSDHSGGHSDEEEDWVRDVEPQERVYRYPPVDNRPPPPRRSFSSKLRHTFAILPTKPDDEYLDGYDGPDRRTIRRTASGNLRVMRHRASLESLKQPQSYDHRPYTAPDNSAAGTGGRQFWRNPGRTTSLTLGSTGRILPALGNKLEELQNLPRRISERRREKRSQELRQKISGPKEVRDGVGDVIRRGSKQGQNGTVL